MTEKEIKTIDLTPTWSGVLAILIHHLGQGDRQQKNLAKSELYRMAKLADAYNTIVKESEE